MMIKSRGDSLGLRGIWVGRKVSRQLRKDFGHGSVCEKALKNMSAIKSRLNTPLVTVDSLHLGELWPLIKGSGHKWATTFLSRPRSKSRGSLKFLLCSELEFSRGLELERRKRKWRKELEQDHKWATIFCWNQVCWETLFVPRWWKNLITHISNDIVETRGICFLYRILGMFKNREFSLATQLSAMI